MRRLRHGVHLCSSSAAADTVDDWPSPAPRPKYVRPPRLESGSVEVTDHLDAHGYAIVGGVLTEGECATAVDKLWDFLEKLGSGIDRTDIASWVAPRWPSPSGSMFVSSHGANHCEAAWYVRSRPAIKAMFGSLWGTHDLLVNFDALSVHRPWWHENGDLAWRARSGGYHVDQSSMHPGRFAEPPPEPDDKREYVQGCVNLIPMSPYTGGHVLVPGSHLCFRELMARHKIPDNDFPIPATEPLLTGAVMPHMEAGDVLLFDSRTVQCGAPGLVTPPAAVVASAASAPPQLLHVEVYVTMSPKSKASAATLAQRRQGFATNTGFGSHAAHHRLTTLQFPPTDGDGFTVVPAARLGPQELELVG